MVTTIVRIDEFGDTYFDIMDFELAQFVLGDSLLMAIDGKTFEVPFHSGPYCKMFEPVLVRKKDKIFLSIRHGNAAEKFGIHQNQQIVFSLLAPKKFWEKENAYSFEEITNESVYKTKEEFANFRSVMPGKGLFYRSSSPIDDAYGRAKSVVYCIEKYKIKTIIDMADSENELRNLIDTIDDGTRLTMQTRKIYAIGDDSGLYSQKFADSVLTAMKLIISVETPCLIHCRAGKRRSGFICAIIQALRGMNAEQIMEDYMISYENNNKVTYLDNPKRYEYLKNDTIKKILQHINGIDLSCLKKTTKNYLKNIGLTCEEISLLEQKVCQ